jgi:GntR family transcriptional regulator
MSGILRLDHHSPLPLHAQVEQLLREMIKERAYQDGALLPDEVSLSRQLGISRNTLRAAISRLVYAGLLERRAGVGTRVISPALESGIGQWHSFTHEMQRKGVDLQTFAITARLVDPPADAMRAMKLDEGRKVLRLDRLRGWDDVPVVHFRSFLHPRLGLKDDGDFSRPLYEIIESQTGVTADHAHEEMRAVASDVAMSKLLGIRRGTPLLQRNRIVYDASHRPIEYAIVHYLSARFALSLDIQRGKE